MIREVALEKPAIAVDVIGVHSQTRQLLVDHSLSPSLHGILDVYTPLYLRKSRALMRNGVTRTLCIPREGYPMLVTPKQRETIVLNSPGQLNWRAQWQDKNSH